MAQATFQSFRFVSAETVAAAAAATTTFLFQVDRPFTGSLFVIYRFFRVSMFVQFQKETHSFARTQPQTLMHTHSSHFVNATIFTRDRKRRKNKRMEDTVNHKDIFYAFKMLHNHI